jgi:hypothetical protein
VFMINSWENFMSKLEQLPRGYIIVAMNFEEQQLAATCAYSIKIKNLDANISLVCPLADGVYQHLQEPFDYIIEFPYATVSDRRANDWQLYWATPYANTIVVDCHTLVKESHNQVWDYLESHHDIAFCSQTLSFRGWDFNFVPKLYLEHEFTQVNSTMFFFRKDTECALNYFKLADPFMRNWRDALDKQIHRQFIPDTYDTDLMHSVLVNGLGIINDVIPSRGVLDIVDMRTADLEFEHQIDNSWIEYLNTWPSENTKIKLQNYAINTNIFYYNPAFLTDEIYFEHRDYYRYLTKQTSVVD